MQYSEARLGRTFVIRLEQGDIVHEAIEQLCADESIRAAALVLVGGADQGSRLVVGPERGTQRPIVPQVHALQDVHEVAGTGTVFWDEAAGRPVAHIHLACGRGDQTVTGCAREGVAVWQLMEVVLWEIAGTAAARVPNPELGFAVLEP